MPLGEYLPYTTNLIKMSKQRQEENLQMNIRTKAHIAHTGGSGLGAKAVELVHCLSY